MCVTASENNTFVRGVGHLDEAFEKRTRKTTRPRVTGGVPWPPIRLKQIWIVRSNTRKTRRRGGAQKSVL